MPPPPFHPQDPSALYAITAGRFFCFDLMQFSIKKVCPETKQKNVLKFECQIFIPNLLFVRAFYLLSSGPEAFS